MPTYGETPYGQGLYGSGADTFVFTLPTVEENMGTDRPLFR